jgi:hypothetical protein
MPVTDMKSVLSAPDSDARNRLIVEHLNRLEDELAQTRGAVTELRDLLERADTPFVVEHRTVAPTPAIGIQQTVDRSDLTYGQLGAYAMKHEISVNAPYVRTTSARSSKRQTTRSGKPKSAGPSSAPATRRAARTRSGSLAVLAIQPTRLEHRPWSSTAPRRNPGPTRPETPSRSSPEQISVVDTTCAER